MKITVRAITQTVLLSKFCNNITYRYLRINLERKKYFARDIGDIGDRKRTSLRVNISEEKSFYN